MYQSPFEVPQIGLTQIHPLLSRHSQPAWTYLPAASPAAPFCTLALRNLLPAKTALGACMGRCWGRCCSADAEPGPTLGVLIWCGRPECSMAAVDRKRKVPGRQAGNALLDISSDEEEEVRHRALLRLLMRGLSCARMIADMAVAALSSTPGQRAPQARWPGHASTSTAFMARYLLDSCRCLGCLDLHGPAPSKHYNPAHMPEFLFPRTDCVVRISRGRPQPSPSSQPGSPRVAPTRGWISANLMCAPHLPSSRSDPCTNAT